jgi:hypothetical protein
MWRTTGVQRIDRAAAATVASTAVAANPHGVDESYPAVLWAMYPDLSPGLYIFDVRYSERFYRVSRKAQGRVVIGAMAGHTTTE